MSHQRKKRWMGVAHRAADFRALIHASEVSAATDEVQARTSQHQASRAASQQAHLQWNGRLRTGALYAQEVTQWKLYQRHLHSVETASADQLQQAQVQLAGEQARLRSTLGERDALQASLDRLNERLRREQAQAGQKDADELWQLRNLGASHED